MNGIFREIVWQLPDLNSGVTGSRGFNPIMMKMWGIEGLKSDIGKGLC
jgi:hypothetical protein